MKKKIILVAVLVLALAAFFAFRGERETAAPATLYATVAEGPLVISVEEFGEIAPSQQIVLKNEVQGRCSIISLVPEGSIVKEGDVLVQLDISAKIDERDSQEITLQNAQSALEVAREELEIQRNQAASDVELAEENFLFAKEDLAKYEEGEYPSGRRSSSPRTSSRRRSSRATSSAGSRASSPSRARSASSSSSRPTPTAATSRSSRAT